MFKMKNVKWVFASVFVLFLVGCGNQVSNAMPKIQKTEDVGDLKAGILQSNDVTFLYNKRTGQLQFLNAYPNYKFSFYYSKWDEYEAFNTQNTDEVKACIYVDELKNVYKPCTGKDNNPLFEISRNDVIIILEELRKQIKYEFKSAGNNIEKLEDLQAKFLITIGYKEVIKRAAFFDLFHKLYGLYLKDGTSQSYLNLYLMLVSESAVTYYLFNPDGTLKSKEKRMLKDPTKYLRLASKYAKTKSQREKIKEVISADKYRVYGDMVKSSKNIAGYEKYLTNAGVKKDKMISENYAELKGYKENLTLTEFSKSDYYKHVLSQDDPDILTGHNGNDYFLKLDYDIVINHIPQTKTFNYTFTAECQYIKTITSTENLGFMELSMADSKNVTRKIYTCKPKGKDKAKIQRMLSKIHGGKYLRKVNNDLLNRTWTKKVFVGKTYNRSTYKAPVSTTISNTSTQKISSNQGCVYKNGYVVCDGIKIGSVWCGINCTGNCLKGYIYGSSDDRFGDKDRAIQGIISRCKK